MDDFGQYSKHSPFTQFAHRLLTNTTLSEAIYHLQHNSGFNINIVFYLLWSARARYGRLTKQQISLLQSHVLSWHQRVLAELKYTHALLAHSVDPVVVQIKRELQHEITRAHFIEQQMLYDTKLKARTLHRSLEEQLADASCSLIRYCELKNDLLIDGDQASFSTLLCAVFDECERPDLENQIQNSFKHLEGDANLPYPKL